jgi:hypothetical protein
MKYLWVLPAVVVVWYAYWLRQLHKMLSGFDKDWMHRDWPGWELTRSPASDSLMT